MSKKKENHFNYISLPRGGYLADTEAGYIQFGAPPETIKDTMTMEKGVPHVYVVMEKMFDWAKGISLAEIEFPLYYNYFIKKTKTHVLCRKDQVTRLKAMLQEALFGPKKLDLSVDYDDECSACSIPDIRKEMDYFRSGMKLSDVVGILVFEDRSCTVGDATITYDDEGTFHIFHGKKLVSSVPGSFSYKPSYSIGERLPEPYNPPLFSVTCLGPSHGFDPTQNTSGYIIWLNHHGIMIDPPVNSTEWLRDSNVNPKLIDGIILTHCHADHDAGTFQKILEEGKITIFSTETVMMSFLRKYAALSDMSVANLMKLFTFHPIRIGKPEFIHGGKFQMFYSLHSIPTFGFKMDFQDQTFVYSSDHNNDPSVHKKLLDNGVINQNRYQEFRDFPWDSKVIYHESGVPPLHTPISYLNSLPEDLQKRIIVYHIAAKDFPKETSLSLATFGIEKTLVFPTTTPYYDKAYQVLNVLNHLDFFSDMEVSKAQSFLTIVQEEHFRKGDHIIRKGTKGDKFYVILSGNVSVVGEGLEHKKIYGTYEYFGEVAIITGQERQADVLAETDVIAYSVGREEFLDFIEGTEFKKTLVRLAKVRSSDSWNLLSASPLFRYCSSYQKTWLESILLPVKKDGKGVLVREGERLECVYIIRKGTVQRARNGEKAGPLRRGDYVGNMTKMYRRSEAEYTYSYDAPISLYAINRPDFLKFAQENPGLLMKYLFSE